MTSTITSTNESRRYQRWMNGLLFVGGGTFIALAIAWLVTENNVLPLVGVVVWWIAALAALAVWRFTPVVLYDERDTHIEQRASHLTVGVIGYAILFGLPAMVVFDATNLYAIPIRIRGIFEGFIFLMLIFGLSYVWVQSKRS